MGFDDEQAALAALGIRLASEAELPGVRAECVRIARRLRQLGGKVVGLLPTSDDVAVPPIGVQLGLALADVSGGTVAFVDANVRWPAMASAAALDGDGGGGAFATRWLRGSFALLTPQRAGAAGAGVPQLAAVIKHGAELFAHVLVDLTGFEKLGEHLAAIEMTNGVLLVGRAGRTREEELLRINRALPPQQNLGVLLVG